MKELHPLLPVRCGECGGTCTVERSQNPYRTEYICQCPQCLDAELGDEDGQFHATNKQGYGPDPESAIRAYDEHFDQDSFAEVKREQHV